MSALDPMERIRADAAEFRTTHWSVVLAGGQRGSGDADAALENLCRAYRFPLYACVRRSGHDAHAAQGLTQSFFARFVEKEYLHQVDRGKGRFRSFLLAALKHFLADDWDRAHRQKRGGGREIISLDAYEAEERYRLEPVDAIDPAQLYDRRWATTLLTRAIARLEEEFIKAGQRDRFERLHGYLVGDRGGPTYSEVAAVLGLTKGGVKMAVSRMRARCRELIRDEIAQTGATPAEIEEEYRDLFAVLTE